MTALPLTIGIGWGVLGWGVDPLVFGEAAPDALNQQFQEKVRPLFEQYCYECHSHAAKRAKGGLVLDSRSGWEVGGASGPAVVAGEPDESLLIQAIRYSDLEMPPDGRLPEEDIETLVQWVAQGAFDSREGEAASRRKGIDLESGRQHWAFQPLMESDPPEVRDQAWPRTSVDRYILGRLEEAGLAAMGDADPYTWMRRAHFDLTGLPPSPDQIRAFARDPSPSAKERVVDRLLASRAFGERWGRHWLDLVGYADQVGTSNNVFAEHAWRYRDYVIESYNSDKPFDEFIREQLAGDLLESRSVAERADQITATGFLVLGDIEIVEADKEKLLVDIVDQQVNKVGRAFLGMTLECARCHDHKFDPVSQRDYYAMGGFFHNTLSIYKTERGVWSDVNVLQLPESAAEKKVRERTSVKHFMRLSGWKKEREALQARGRELGEALKEEGRAPEERDRLKKEQEGVSTRLGELNRRIPHAEYFYPKHPVAHGVKEVASPQEMRITIRGNPRALGEAVPRGFLSALGGGIPEIPTGQSGRLQLADWIVDQPLAARVMVNRVWQKLFGEGLVRTVDYFGVPGDRPSHPALLDALSLSLVQDEWSIKRLVRRLVLSRSYGLASRDDAGKAKMDPENRLLWRMNRFRLDAEALRDAMIMTAGQLVSSAGGPAMPLEFPENVGGLDPKDVNPRSFRFSKWRPEQAFERTVYLPVIRHAAQPGPANLRNVFDFAQPSEFSGKRSVTAVPTQALFLMNDREVKKWARALANRIQTISDQPDRLEELWLVVFNRPISREEEREASEFLASLGAIGWEELCHALLASNEFLMRL